MVEADRPRGAGGHLEGLPAVPGFEHGVAALLQDLPRQLPHGVLVLDEEHRPAAIRDHRGGRPRRSGRR